MGFDRGQRPDFERLLGRLRWVVPILLLVGAGAVAGLERWRPERIEPFRHGVFNLLSAYLDPIRLSARKLSDAGRRAAGRWLPQDDAEELRRRIMQLEADLQVSREQARRLERVSGLSLWGKSPELNFIIADVVGFATDDRSAALTINRGRLDGVREGFPVVGQRGLAGVIREVADRSARVQAITDPLNAVGVADAETRHRGIVRGQGRGQGREAEAIFIPETEIQPIVAGAILVTSGLANSLYPKGLVVGTITGKATSEHGMVHGIVEPAERFSRLEEALVIRPADAHEAGEGSDAEGLWQSLSRYTIKMTTGTLQRMDTASFAGPRLDDLPTTPSPRREDLPTTPALGGSAP